MSFQRYGTYRDSRVEWLGDVPSAWRVEPIKRNFRVVGGATPKSDVEAYWDGELPWVTPADLSKLNGWLIHDTSRTITQEGIASCAAELVPAGSVILSTRAPIGSLGIAAVPICTNQGCKALVPAGDMDARFLAYCLSAAADELNNRGRGTTFLELSGDELRAFALPLPTQQEQRAVLAFLDRETAKIDALVEEQRRLIDFLKEKRQAFISHAVTKGLNPNVPMKDSGIEWLGEVPAHWEMRRAKHIFRKSDLAPPEASEVVTCFRDGQVTLRRNRREEGFTFAVLEVGYQGVRPGQLVLHSMDAFAGAIGVSDSIGKCSPEYLVCDPWEDDTCPYYFGRLLRLMALRGFILAVCPSVRERAPRIRFPDFADLLLPYPPPAEQAAIAQRIDDELAQLGNLQAAAEDAVGLLQERRAALISAAVTGKIDVRDTAAAQAALEPA